MPEILIDPTAAPADNDRVDKLSMSKPKSLFSDVKKQLPTDRDREPGSRPLKRKVDLKSLRPLVGEVRAEDGVDPRDEARHRSRRADDLRLAQAHGTRREGEVLSQRRTGSDSALQAAVGPLLNW